MTRWTMIAAICAVVAPATINAQYDGTYAGYNGYASQNPSASIEDTLKVSDHVVKLATKLRADRKKAERDASFGFNKTENLE